MEQDRGSSSLLYDVLDAAIEITGAYMGNVQLLQEGVLRIVAQRGFHAPFLKFFETVHEGGHASCGTALQQRERVIVEDVTSSPIFKGSAALDVLLAAGVRAVESTPIIGRAGRLIGVFSTHYRERHRPDQRELRLLDLLAHQASAFIERDQTLAAWAAKERQLATITENAGGPVTQCSRDLRYVFANQAYARLIGLPVEQIIGRPIVDVLGPETFETIRPFVERVLSGERVEYRASIMFPGTGERYAQVTYVPDIDGDGNVQGWFASLADITDLHEAQEALKAADRHKDEFIAVLGHELRNPLAVIRNGVAILTQPGLAGQGGVTLEILGRQIDHMSRLVDDLLDVNRVGRGSIELRKTRTDLATIINQAVVNRRAMIQSKEHKLTVFLPKESVYLVADADRLAQAIGNLLGNATKFMEPGGRIEITGENLNDVAVIRVRDYGIGLAPEDTRRIFEMFTQVDTSMHRANGLGIGLTLVKGIVEGHGGTVEARSDGPGHGTEFIVRIPIIAAEATQPATATSAPAKALSALELTIYREILIVDDNRDSAHTLSELLRAYGHTTHLAYDGSEAVEAVQRLRPEVVLLDIGLPTLNGYEACRSIRSHPWGKKMLLVALTGYGQARDALDAMQAGFDHHLIKPVNLETLQALLAALPPRDESRPAH